MFTFSWLQHKMMICVYTVIVYCFAIWKIDSKYYIFTLNSNHFQAFQLSNNSKRIYTMLIICLSCTHSIFFFHHYYLFFFFCFFWMEFGIYTKWMLWLSEIFSFQPISKPFHHTHKNRILFEETAKTVQCLVCIVNANDYYGLRNVKYANQLSNIIQ